MKLSRKQLEEIDFLSKQWKLNPTQEEKEEYINHTVKGNKTNETNPLFQAKRRLDINIKSWREDLAIGTLSIQELKEDFNHPYMDKVLKGIVKGLRNDDILSRIALGEYFSGSETGKLALVNRIK